MLLNDLEAISWFKDPKFDPLEHRFGGIIGDHVLFAKSGKDKTIMRGTLVGWRHGGTGPNMMIEADDPEVGTVFTRPALVWTINKETIK
ncbi:hypothetical protein [Delftia phage PhiW-14]|uniref:Uncharacterized protein n=1 Tax=Delftia phage PhiW-14 TaxID=665032 RepID=C9DG39_BPW14|nr:hypothetical protein DP-phiW-14_gp068 [Delftia phage PhiW-14]ACV50090.1 hypothetical protein [Delftia phage PhiW-14]